MFQMSLRAFVSGRRWDLGGGTDTWLTSNGSRHSAAHC